MNRRVQGLRSTLRTDKLIEKIRGIIREMIPIRRTHTVPNLFVRCVQ